ncbi:MULTISPECIES: hypothetical protein [unclassified Streptomyces]|uniref:hypothetical protein n=1 Tax=unclassified Streptomyces TaxID=2593676 RepID=UPI00136CB67C|nr:MULTISPECIES: hypothetical protein [unclassified Streptomyces]MYT73370.1 hypothetical protein [Streptomyces sp. SID8367]
MDGAVAVPNRRDGIEQSEHLTPGGMCCVERRDTHPAPQARVLVVGQRGSI